MTAHEIVAELDRLYTGAVARLQAALDTYISTGTPPSPESRRDGSFAYPEIRLSFLSLIHI